MRFVFLPLFLILSLSAFGQDQSHNPSMVVHLLDYLAKDYGGAVQDGKIISKSEYNEQMEFVEIVEKSVHSLPEFSANKDFQKKVSNLVHLIKDKKSADEVSKNARVLQSEAIQIAKIQIAPAKWPDFEKGHRLFTQSCTACHGEHGLGDGPSGITLNPKPANFQDPENMTNSSPFRYFNTIRLGVPGTAMAAFSNLSDEDVWDLAFYIKALGHQNKGSLEEKPSLGLLEVSSLNDQQILEKLSGDNEQKKEELAGLRTYTPKLGTDYFLSMARGFLSQSSTEYENGKSEIALATSLKAYLDGIEPIEPKIKANDPALVVEIEEKMGGYREAIKSHAPVSVIKEKQASAMATLKTVEEKLTDKGMSPSMAFVAAFSIFLREGFEAVLIIIVLLSVTKAMGMSEANKWIHFGWLAALALGLMLWFASGIALSLSGASREVMEASISLFAVVVLIYVGFWLHQHSEAKKWQEFLHSKVKLALDNKSLIVLSSISFIAVFREAFEVVLFLRAIWFELNKSGKLFATTGVVTSFVLIFALAYLLLRNSRKLPIGVLFKVCSATMVVLAFVLLGKGIHSFQESGISSITTISAFPRFDLLGMFPTLETLLAQGTLLLLMFYLFKIRNLKAEPIKE